MTPAAPSVTCCAACIPPYWLGQRLYLWPWVPGFVLVEVPDVDVGEPVAVVDRGEELVPLVYIEASALPTLHGLSAVCERRAPRPFQPRSSV